MTSDEALAWIEANDVQVTRAYKCHGDYEWNAGAWQLARYMTAAGHTLIEAVTRLKAKLEAGR